MNDLLASWLSLEVPNTSVRGRTGMAWLIFDQYYTFRSQLLCDRLYSISVPSLHSRLKRRSEWQTLTWRRHFDKENLEHHWNSWDTWVRSWCLCLTRAGSSPGSWWSLSSTDTRAWVTNQTLWLFQVTMIMPWGHALYCQHNCNPDSNQSLYFHCGKQANKLLFQQT